MSNRFIKPIQKPATAAPPVFVYMAVENQEHGDFEVIFTSKTVVKATTTSPSSPNPHVLTLSNLDLLSGRFPVTYFYFYPKPQVPGCHFPSIVHSLKTSLAQTLTYYYPFSGRIVENPKTSEPEIICDNTGALLVEAQANIALRNLDFYDLNRSLQGKLVSITNLAYPLQIQVTGYTCGAISITFTFDHALGDASAFGKFLVSWSEIARNKPISCLPDHRRRSLVKARSPPTYHPALDQTFVKCTIKEIINMPTIKTLVKRLYHVDAASINMLHNLACAGGARRTKIEAFSAYIWKVMVTATGKNSTDKCKMGWLVDGRLRMSGSSMSDYIGNVLSLAVGEASVTELKRGSMPDIASNVHEAISKVANGDHFQDLVDWIECHRPGLMLSKVVLGQGGGPALVLSSGRRFPVAELDYGFGKPVLGTVCSTIERIGVGYMNQRESALGDGSWVVSAILWPQLVAALELDSIFQPMSATHHLHL